MLKDANVAHGVAFGADRGQELQFAVEQCLAPLGMAGAHAEHALPQGQWPAMFRQGGAGKFWPVLPQRGHGAILSPLLTQPVQAALQRLRRSRGRRDHQFAFSEAASLRFRSPSHGRSALKFQR